MKKIIMILASLMLTVTGIFVASPAQADAGGIYVTTYYETAVYSGTSTNTPIVSFFSGGRALCRTSGQVVDGANAMHPGRWILVSDGYIPDVKIVTDTNPLTECGSNY